MSVDSQLLLRTELAAALASAPNLVACAYYAVTALLAAYGAHRVWMLWRFRRAALHPLPRADRPLRSVTVQLPIFNERTVAARLLRCAAGLDYPREKLEIQVLDDSTDNTRAIVEREVDRLRRSGLDIRVLRRPTREGFKAGALDAGLRAARGELLCVFDADFMPPPGFLGELAGHFEDPRVGMVQARWGHANRDESWLTRAQATLLDGHFVVENSVRHERGLFFNFNGTAGIWRREAIESSGGWQHDTLTEDLDLSYRAQLLGWRFVYRADVAAPAEVPADIASFKSQQRRWARGGMQVVRKLGLRILRARQPVRVKAEAAVHLLGNVGYTQVLLMGLLLPLAIRVDAGIPLPMHGLFFCASTLSVLAFYECSQRALGRPLGSRLLDTLLAVVMGIGMSSSQTLAVLSGLRAERGTFERTPKRGDAPRSWLYRSPSRGVPGMELLFAAWLAFGLGEACLLQAWVALPFLVLFFSGHLWVGVLSLRQWLAERGRGALEPSEPLGPLESEGRAAACARSCGSREEPSIGAPPALSPGRLSSPAPSRASA
jgi:cellulose synthase/poly-beta-1,6-N-acetylglucosamine synthase-like glycosyltransferase